MNFSEAFDKATRALASLKEEKNVGANTIYLKLMISDLCSAAYGQLKELTENKSYQKTEGRETCPSFNKAFDELELQVAHLLKLFSKQHTVNTEDESAIAAELTSLDLALKHIRVTEPKTHSS